MTNGSYGFTVQKLICEKYRIIPCDKANKQFEKQYAKRYKNNAERKINKIFEKIKDKPVKCVTYEKDENGRLYDYNFLLESGKTLSIKSNIGKNTKVTVNKIGQPGYEILNEYFSEIYGKRIASKNDIKTLFLRHISEIMPIYFNHLFTSDYTAYVKSKNKSVTIIDNSEIDFIDFEAEKFDFTCNRLRKSKYGKKWNVSTTVKYDDIRIAEIEVGVGKKNRLLIFRIYLDEVPRFIEKIKMNNETLGISAEAAICEVFELEQPASFRNRILRSYVDKLIPVVKNAFEDLPPAIKHSGSDAGERAAQSKCKYDFLLKGNVELSLKTNKGNMICPPEVGQPGASTCLLYFSKYLEKDDTEMTKIAFKRMALKNIHKLMPIYVQYLFDSEWLLWIKEYKGDYSSISINKKHIKEFNWEKEKFSFTKPTLEEWNVSNTVKYDGLNIGEFEIHNSRNCFKFRFNFKNLLKLVYKKDIDKKDDCM